MKCAKKNGLDQDAKKPIPFWQGASGPTKGELDISSVKLTGLKRQTVMRPATVPLIV